MNVDKIEIRPHEQQLGWFRCFLVSKQTAFGITKIELICSDETLRQIRNACNQALDEKEITASEENSVFRNGRLKNFGK